MGNTVYYRLAFLLLLCRSCRSTAADNNCVEEFGLCVMNRDCCGSIDCVAGDWAVTTDSTCLSQRSQSLNNLKEDEKGDLIAEYYRSLPGDGKTPEQVQKLVAKYERNFAQLVTRLEKKYNVPWPGDPGMEQKEEL